MSGAPSDLSLFFGRLHPLLVHLPIGFLVLLVCLEVLARWPRFRKLKAACGVVLALAVPATALSALCGWLLSRGGGYDARLLDWHLWSGFGVAGACLLAFLLERLNWRAAYDTVLAATFVGLLVASHFGGSLTHGSDYLTRYAPAPLRRLVGGEPAVQSDTRAGGAGKESAFATLVQPMLDRSCVSCHGPAKAKADLRLDTLAAMVEGGANGPVVQPGNAAASELIKRLRLPPDHEDHMPPEGKPPLTTDEIALLQWWIDAGASADQTATELKLPAGLQHFTAANTIPPAVSEPPSVAPRSLGEILPLAERLAAELGISLFPLAQNEPWLQVNASLARTNFGDGELAKLAPLALNLRWLDLTGTRITDTGLAQVAAMKHLNRLHLARTEITDAGLVQLAALGELEYLDLHGTPVTDTVLEQLKLLPQLRRLYLWQTGVSTNAAKAFAERSLDQEQINRWQTEIATLTAKIKSQGISVDVGTPLATAQPPEGKPINDRCPVSGKEIEPTRTTVYEGKLVAFCCADCQAKFAQDPKPFLGKLGLVSPNSPPPKDPKP